MTDAPKIDEARLRELAEADHAVIQRCCNRMPKLYRRGSDVGEYIHSDVADLINIIGRMSDALSAERERGDRAVKVIERISKVRGAYGVEHVPGTEKPQMDRLADPAQLASNFLATQKAEGAP